MALTKVTRYGVDEYALKINNGGNIVFDPGSGNVTIRGNLDVLGETTTIGSTELIVADKTITINDQSDATVPLDGVPDIGDGLGRSAGLVIDRGTLANAYLFFDENEETYINGVLQTSGSNGTGGAFVFKYANGDLSGINTTSIIAGEGNDLNLLPGQTVGVVTVTQTTDYEKQVFPYTGNDITPNPFNSDRLSNPFDPDIIPNIQSVIDYVRDYHLYNWQNSIKAPTPDGDTSVTAYDTSGGDPVSKVEVDINGISITEFFQDRVHLSGIKLQSNTIAPLNINGNLVLEANGTGSIYTEFPLELAKQSDPAAPIDGIKLYSKVEADGGTGLFFVNENSTRDEIISRNKALLYSIIF